MHCVFRPIASFLHCKNSKPFRRWTPSKIRDRVVLRWIGNVRYYSDSDCIDALH
jgi:hypothetical protein